MKGDKSKKDIPKSSAIEDALLLDSMSEEAAFEYVAFKVSKFVKQRKKRGRSKAEQAIGRCFPCLDANQGYWEQNDSDIIERCKKNRQV